MGTLVLTGASSGSATLQSTDATTTVITLPATTGTVALASTIIGVGQTWQDVTASRALVTTYTNSTGKPIQVNVWLSVAGSPTGNLDLNIIVGSVTVAFSSSFHGTAAGNWTTFVTAIVPTGTTYSATSPVNIGGTLTWVELR